MSVINVILPYVGINTIERERKKMDNTNTTSLLSAFATIKSLSDAKKYESPYQILAEFIRHIIDTKSLHSFSSAEMKNRLNEQFGFIIPESVIKTAARRMPDVTLENGLYTVSSLEKESHSLFQNKIKEAEDISSNLIDTIATYVQTRTDSADVQKDALAQELISFLIEDQQNAPNDYLDLISEFIIKNEDNAQIQAQLSQIREGSILYIGLNHNINETGSITKPLTLYLGTEILFSLVGFNGEIYKQFADDFFNLVRTANTKGQKKIRLKYFADVKKEMDEFFFTAEEIVEGKSPQLNNKPAMIAITNGCSTASDVTIKKSDFYHTLQYSFGITEDTEDDFYDESLFESNLESFDYIEDDEKGKKEKGIKYISHINKLRKGAHFNNDIDSGYLIVTNTKVTILISQEQVEKIKNDKNLEFVANFAVSLDRITSLLWYKLGKGFGKKEFPSSINAVLRARIVLSSSIAQKANTAFFDTKKQYQDGKITEDQLAARIITLRNKPKLPEELQGENIDEIMDFSPDFLRRYEERVESDQKALKEKEELIEKITKRSETQDQTITDQGKIIAEKDKTISNQNGVIAEKNKIISDRDSAIAEKDHALAESEDTISTQQKLINEQNEELEKYHRRETENEEKREKRKKVFQFATSVLLKLLVFGTFSFTIAFIVYKGFPDLGTTVSITLGILSLLLACIPTIRKDYKKYFKK